MYGERHGIRELRYDLPADQTMLPRFSGADGALREARAGELDIFGGDVPDYGPEFSLALGGEGMIGTPNAYADFLRLLLNGGELNGARLLDEATIAEMVAPQTRKTANGATTVLMSGSRTAGLATAARAAGACGSSAATRARTAGSIPSLGWWVLS